MLNSLLQTLAWWGELFSDRKAPRGKWRPLLVRVSKERHLRLNEIGRSPQEGAVRRLNGVPCGSFQRADEVEPYVLCLVFGLRSDGVELHLHWSRHVQLIVKGGPHGITWTQTGE